MHGEVKKLIYNYDYIEAFVIDYLYYRLSKSFRLNG
jgi:hypothetical protein